MSCVNLALVNRTLEKKRRQDFHDSKILVVSAVLPSKNDLFLILIHPR